MGIRAAAEPGEGPWGASWDPKLGWVQGGEVGCGVRGGEHGWEDRGPTGSAQPTRPGTQAPPSALGSLTEVVHGCNLGAGASARTRTRTERAAATARAPASTRDPDSAWPRPSPLATPSRPRTLLGVLATPRVGLSHAPKAGMLAAAPLKWPRPHGRDSLLARWPRPLETPLHRRRSASMVATPPSNPATPSRPADSPPACWPRLHSIGHAFIASAVSASMLATPPRAPATPSPLREHVGHASIALRLSAPRWPRPRRASARPDRPERATPWWGGGAPWWSCARL